MHILRYLVISLVIGGFWAAPLAADETRLMRFPDIHNDQIVFCYAGDLWLVSSQGGNARRLTSHIGEELHPKFSPDGKYIAFTGDYDGYAHIYVIPAEGGNPRQLTFHPDYDMMVDWFPDGKKILFRSRREEHWANNARLFSIPLEGGLPVELPLPESGLAAFSPDAKKLAYNRKFREFRTWKRYKGGTEQNIWIYDLDNNQTEKITDWEGTENCPMWHQDKIFFNSDRDYTLNIFSFDLNTREIKKSTNYNEYDVKWPSVGPGKIVYENGGYIYILDIESGKSTKVPIQVKGDMNLSRPKYEKVTDLIRSFDISPSAKRAVFEARGDIFTAPAEKGEIRNLTQTPGEREIYPAWSPDGKWIAYYSDKTGEYDLYLRPQAGGEEQRITSDADCYRYSASWSPDSKKILYADQKKRLYYLDIEDKKPILIEQAEYTPVHYYSWSPDSKWIAYTINAGHYYEAIFLYSLEENKSYKITDDLNDDLNPVFDPDGKYLYFISLRSFHPIYSEFEHEYVYRNTRNIYFLTLQADSLSPFAPESDEEEVEQPEEDEKDADKEDEEAEDKKDEDKDDKDIQIDFKGIDQRIVGIPVSAGRYRNLAAGKDKIFYISDPAISGEGQSELHMYLSLIHI